MQAEEGSVMSVERKRGEKDSDASSFSQECRYDSNEDKEAENAPLVSRSRIESDMRSITLLPIARDFMYG